MVVCVLLLAGAACSDDDGEEAGVAATTSTAAVATTGASTTSAPAAVTTSPSSAPATTTTPANRAATAVLEPDSIAGVEVGSNKSDAIAALGPPTSTGRETDLSGAMYDFQRWDFAGNRGLILNYRTPAVTSPLLTDWTATAPGPATVRGIKVGDPASAVVAAYGPLTGFCCDRQIASIEKGAFRMIVVVEPGANVTQIIGGDPGFWSRSIAD